MDFFSIKNWNELQHYNDRTPPWIKLYNHLLDDYEFACLQDASKLHLVLIWLLASRNSNRLPYNPKWIKQRIGVDSDVDLDELVVSGFIEVEPSEIGTLQLPEQGASKTLAERKQGDTAKERERRERVEGEGEQRQKKKTARFTPDISMCESWGWPYAPNEETFTAWLQMRKQKKHTISENSFKLIGAGLREAVTSGFTVDQCLAKAELQGWKGFQAAWMTNSQQGSHTRQPDAQREQELDDWANGKTAGMFDKSERAIEGEVVSRG